MKTIAINLLFVFVAAAFLACDSDMVNSSATSGIEGTVLRGPTCPVQQEGETCPDEPFNATFHVFDANENEVAMFQSDAEGNFSVSLPAGDYVIVPDEQAPLFQPTQQQKEVTVTENNFTDVTLLFDTGIR